MARIGLLIEFSLFQNPTSLLGRVSFAEPGYALMENNMPKATFLMLKGSFLRFSILRKDKRT
jgi:hypothetical protein